MGASKKTFMEEREKAEKVVEMMKENKMLRDKLSRVRKALGDELNECENHKELVSECKRYLVEVVMHMEQFPNQYKNYMHIWKAGLDMSGLMNDIKEY